MSNSLSIKQARKLVLHSQQLPPKASEGKPLTAIREAIRELIKHLGYLQIDTISVVERAHHHVLWSRNPRYEPQHLGQLLADKMVFEYWSHAAAYLPIEHYRYTLVRKHAIKSGALDHWYPRRPKLMAQVLARIAEEGPLMAKDFAKGAAQIGVWESKPAKQALEYLFMQGDLMIPQRRGFHKVYDLSERVLAADTDTTPPSEAQYQRFLIRQFLKANGLAQASEMAYLLKNMRGKLQPQLDALCEDGQLQTVLVEKQPYFMLSESRCLLDKPLKRQPLSILSPFDNLLIQRRRMRNLFAFDYQLECYIPAAKRRYGYFCLPLLWQGELIGRIDCKVNRREQVFYVHDLHIEKPLPNLARFALERFTLARFTEALATALRAFMRFNACNRLQCASKLTAPINVKHLAEQVHRPSPN